jgi:hypothetical protein
MLGKCHMFIPYRLRRMSNDSRKNKKSGSENESVEWHSFINNKSYRELSGYRSEDSKRREDVRENGILRHDFRFS